jgi:hypothetical protein
LCAIGVLSTSFPTIERPAGSLAVGAHKEPGLSSVARQWAQNNANEIARPIVPLYLDQICQVWRERHRRLDFGAEADGFPRRAILRVCPDQKVGDFSRIVEHPAHDPCGQKRDNLAIHSAPEEASTPVASRFSLLHRLIPLFVFSLKIPTTGSIFIETVKVDLAEPILSTNYPSLDLPSPQIGPQRSRVHSQNTRRLAECQQLLPY